MNAITNSQLSEQLAQEKIVAIIRGTDIDATVQTAQTLIDSGIRMLEITLTLDGALEAITRVNAAAPSGVVVGAGTVLTEHDADAAIAAGARFIVTPTLSASVDHALRHDIGVLAGVYTPTEIHRMMDAGAAAAKLFPAATVGPGFVRAVRDPLPQARIVPVGGVNVDSVSEWLAAGAWACGVGGPLVADAARPGGDQQALRERARAFVDAVRAEQSV
ncbi:bifunctional 4-hydroxy-2-oxoglutarate aldolase/2-dehydro-3-deoxy-phosphogluconate aldolase [Microbacterium sp. YY-01]|uniref:bifunctional 4-hydroxy-2-oxoglutarate aldolase/2-dehydro-3-deoxy-phosphogluconate aldolase n=1 Tax=Microbacterium sp. YY-01 TaxID=3421634 RepID=UPI003D181DB1